MQAKKRIVDAVPVVVGEADPAIDLDPADLRSADDSVKTKLKAAYPSLDDTVVMFLCELPQEVWPRGPSTGKFNYTVILDSEGEEASRLLGSTKLEVQLKNRAFYLKGLVRPKDGTKPVSPTVKWAKYANIESCIVYCKEALGMTHT